jgi:xanthine/CO dehydrogenase XdhC/CoxF family maturation factor
MMERRQIVRAAQSGNAEVLVTLVHVEGSSYRQPGARLLTAANRGAYTGTVSGGCLEAEVVKKAAWRVRGGPVVEHYSTLYDDTAEIPFGLGCGGSVDLLFEAAGTLEFEALIRALEASLEGEELTVITWLPQRGEPERGESGRGTVGTRGFARAILGADNRPVFASSGLRPAEIEAALIEGSRWDEKAGGVYVERLLPAQRLVVLGAGDDARPLVRMAALLGWSVLVADGRAQLARPERFPEAHRVFVAQAREKGGDVAAVGISAADAVVLMTHSYEQDREWLAAVLPIAPRYFGVLGAKHRSSLLVSEAAAMTGLPLATCCERIYAPVGLDLGGDGPEAIALAVLAEAHARCMGKLGKSLRLSVDDVALQVKNGSGVSRYVQAQCALPASPLVSPVVGQFV